LRSARYFPIGFVEFHRRRSMKDAVVRPEKGRWTQRQVLRGARNSYPARRCETVASQELQKGIVRFVRTWTRRRKLVELRSFLYLSSFLGARSLVDRDLSDKCVSLKYDVSSKNLARIFTMRRYNSYRINAYAKVVSMTRNCTRSWN